MSEKVCWPNGGAVTAYGARCVLVNLASSLRRQAQMDDDGVHIPSHLRNDPRKLAMILEHVADFLATLEYRDD